MELQNLRFEHNNNLDFCRQIKQDLAKNVSPKKIRARIKEYYENNLKAQFEFEEKYVLPILGNGHPNAIQAIREHNSIRALSTVNDLSKLLIKQFISELESHIHFEEKVIFARVEQIANEEQLKQIEEM
jgi:hemerythrin-like domain-containing protein